MTTLTQNELVEIDEVANQVIGEALENVEEIFSARFEREMDEDLIDAATAQLKKRLLAYVNNS